MPGVIDILRSLDRKERFAVLRATLGFDPTTPELGNGFRKGLSACIDVPVPARAFVAMDYHLDWIQLALHLAKNAEIAPGTAFAIPRVSRTSTPTGKTSICCSLSTTGMPTGPGPNWS